MYIAAYTIYVDFFYIRDFPPCMYLSFKGRQEVVHLISVDLMPIIIRYISIGNKHCGRQGVVLVI